MAARKCTKCGKVGEAGKDFYRYMTSWCRVCISDKYYADKDAWTAARNTDLTKIWGDEQKMRQWNLDNPVRTWAQMKHDAIMGIS